MTLSEQKLNRCNWGIIYYQISLWELNSC